MGRNGSGPKARNAAAGLRWPCLQGKAVGPYGRRQVTDLPLPAGSAASQQRDFLWLLSLVTKKVTGGTTPRGGTPPPALAGKSPPPNGWYSLCPWAESLCHPPGWPLFVAHSATSRGHGATTLPPAGPPHPSVRAIPCARAVSWSADRTPCAKQAAT